VIADAGYGGEENYSYLADEQIQAVVKYSTYHKEKTKKWKQDISKIDNWSYEGEHDTWQCPGGQQLAFRYESKQRTESGYEIKLRHYRSADCSGCPLRSACTSAKSNREIRVSMTYLRQKQQARAILQSEEGYQLSVRRMIEPESVFGQIKNNRGFRRFLLRGLPKVSLEVGWLSLAHNFLKWAAMKQKAQVSG
jgi:hypothetical protein